MNALTLPDIAAQASQQSMPLEWVGMCGIALPITLDGVQVRASADAGVSLDDGASRGFTCRACTSRWRHSSTRRFQ